MVARKKFVRTAAAIAALGATLTIGLAGNSPANADPKQFGAFVGVGSDTTQDVLNAFAGFSNGVSYLPVQGGTARTQLISFDATGSPCITSKIGGPTFNRPNGSSAGQRALSRALDGTGYGNSSCGGPTNIAGQVDFARSSSLDGTAGNQLTYIPMGRDGLTFAYYRADGSPITSLTRAQLQTIFTTGSLTVGGVRIIPCGIQTSSGTHATWVSQALGVTAGQEDAATNECDTLINPATSAAFDRSQENEGPALKARGDAADAASNGTQVIIGFSGAAWVAKSNGLGTPAPGPGVGMGAITDDGSGNNLGVPVTGSGTNWTPVASFYDNATFGRTVYNVVSRARINSAGATNLDLKGMFSGPTAAICQAVAARPDYGFTPASDCGSLALERGLRSGQL